MNEIPANLVDVVLPVDEQGYPESEMLADRESGVLWDCCGSASRAFPKSLWVEPREWEARSKENDRNKTWPINYIDRFTNQVPTHECTNHSLTRNIEGARNRARGIIYPDGPKKEFRYEQSAKAGSVWFSAMWPYNKANPRIRGGAGVRQVLEYACTYGMMPDKIQPVDYKFKHTMPGTMGRGNKNQSHGDWVSVAEMPDGWQETAKHFKPLEVIFPESWEQAVSLVINGILVSVGRDGHAIPWARWLWDRQMMEYPDSYDVLRYDSLRTVKYAWQGSFAIVSVTSPDDWRYPAGIAA